MVCVGSLPFLTRAPSKLTVVRTISYDLRIAVAVHFYGVILDILQKTVAKNIKILQKIQKIEKHMFALIKKQLT